MELFFEILLYLLMILGLMSITTTFFNYETVMYGSYIRKKHKDIKVNVKVEIKGTSEEEATRLGWLIAKGKYDNIYDIADEYNVILEKVND